MQHVKIYKKTIDQISPKFRLILLIHKVKKVLTLLANYHVTDCLKRIAARAQRRFSSTAYETIG